MCLHVQVSEHVQVKEISRSQVSAWPLQSLAQEAQISDEKIMDHSAEEIDQANEAAVREDAPQPREFNEEENKAIIPIFKEDEESDDEEERIRLHLQADFDEALDAEWSPAKIPPADDYSRSR